MRILLTGFGFIIALMLGACAGEKPSAARTGSWELIPAQSGISFVSIKNGDIAEAHSFTKISGIVGEDGKALVTIALDSVQTNIDIRDERMRKYLFETENYPVVKIGAVIGSDVLATLITGGRKNIMLALEVEMHGVLENYDADIWVTRLASNKILVQTRLPLLIHGDDFAFSAGLAKLQELANLSAISPSVPVSFSLVFER